MNFLRHWSGRMLRGRKQGGNVIMALGLLSTSIFVAPLAIDVPSYFSVRSQLQNAVDASALAAAAQLPNGRAAAEAAAYSVAAKNVVNGSTIGPGGLTFTYTGNSVQVDATTNVKTLTAPYLCGMQIQSRKQQNPDPNYKAVSVASCDSLALNASAKAEPAARDTILVIDTSSSMSVASGNTNLLGSVQKAANTYVDYVTSLNNKSVDRIGVVDFDQTGGLTVPLTSLTDSPNFSTVRNGISGLKLFNGTGWNTNYEVGLRLALDEIQSRGRNAANKQIIFMTDGYQNLPAPKTPVNYYSYDSDEPYTKCTDIVDNSSQVQSMCYYNSRRQKICPALPSESIPDSYISSSAVSCGQTYTNNMQAVTNSQTDRAKSMGVSVTTIRIYNGADPGSAYPTLKRLLKDDNWEPNSLDYMSANTKGRQYEAQYYDQTGIIGIYAAIAQKIRVKLSS